MEEKKRSRTISAKEKTLISLEKRIDSLEDRTSKLEKGKEKVKGTNQNATLEEDIELLNEKEDYNSLEGLICNEDKKINTIKILTRLRIQNYEIETLALVDSGCTKSIINRSILPSEIIKEFPEPQSAMQMDGSSNIYKHNVSNAQISFLNTCVDFYKPTYKLEKIWVRDLNIRIDFVLGLDFLLHNNGSCLLTRDRVIFSKNMTHTSITTEPVQTKS
ncbi:hypothetical protein H5410_058322, partial [Solanum commersonii]